MIEETVDTQFKYDNEKVAVEQGIIDELVSFIQTFGDGYHVQDTGIDPFWLKVPPLQTPDPYNSGLQISTSMDARLTDPQYARAVPRLLGGEPLTSDRRWGQNDHLHNQEVHPHMTAVSNRRSDSSFATGTKPIVSVLRFVRPQSTSPSWHSVDSSAPNTPAKPVFSPPRKVPQKKGKGAPSGGQKISLRGLIRSAASIV
jgi:hypothetical protein